MTDYKQWVDPTDGRKEGEGGLARTSDLSAMQLDQESIKSEEAPSDGLRAVGRSNLVTEQGEEAPSDGLRAAGRSNE